MIFAVVTGARDVVGEAVDAGAIDAAAVSGVFLATENVYGRCREPLNEQERRVDANVERKKDAARRCGRVGKGDVGDEKAGQVDELWQ